MRPGKPLILGRLGATPVLGLPGNPVSALVCAVLFLLPALERLSGLPGDPPRTRPRPLAGADLPANDRRFDYLRASLASGPDGHPSPRPSRAGQLDAEDPGPGRGADPARARRPAPCRPARAVRRSSRWAIRDLSRVTRILWKV